MPLSARLSENYGILRNFSNHVHFHAKPHTGHTGGCNSIRFEAQLTTWKTSPNRKPLVIRGARQVGKTWLMKEFGKTEFKNFVYINIMLQNSAQSDTICKYITALQ